MTVMVNVAVGLHDEQETADWMVALTVAIADALKHGSTKDTAAYVSVTATPVLPEDPEPEKIESASPTVQDQEAAIAEWTDIIRTAVRSELVTLTPVGQELLDTATASQRDQEDADWHRTGWNAALISVVERLRNGTLRAFLIEQGFPSVAEPRTPLEVDREDEYRICDRTGLIPTFTRDPETGDQVTTVLWDDVLPVLKGLLEGRDHWGHPEPAAEPTPEDTLRERVQNIVDEGQAAAEAIHGKAPTAPLAEELLAVDYHEQVVTRVMLKDRNGGIVFIGGVPDEDGF